MARPQGGFGPNIVMTDYWGYASSGAEVHEFGANGEHGVRNVPGTITSLVTTPSDPEAIYARGVFEHHLWRSSYRGGLWEKIGTPLEFSVHHFAIDPFDRSHIVVTGTDNVVVSFDGAETWTSASGVFGDALGIAAHAVAIGGDSTNKDVWVNLARIDWHENTIDWVIVHSTDGGLTFEDAVEAGPEVRLINSTRIVPVPGISGEILFIGPDCPAITPRLYHYRASDDSVTVITYEAGETLGFKALAFHPTDPNIVYLGHDGTTGCPDE